MTARQKRMLWIALMVAGVGTAAAFALNAFQDNLLYFYSPSDVVAGKAPQERTFRVGGMVTEGSFHRPTGSMEATFVLTDFAHDVTVRYTGVLPDLFREGQGVVARGRIAPDGNFVAEEVLAKHDENYMPPDVADTLKQQHKQRATQSSPVPPTT